MKVDKAVCTNDTLDDLTKAIKYDAVFTTLVENKILAIKRDCEEKKRAKKQKRKSFGRILFGKRIFGGGSKKTVGSGDVDLEEGDYKKSICSKTEEITGIKSEPDEKKPKLKFQKPQDIESEDDDNTSISLRTAFPIETQGDDSNGSNGNGSLSEPGTRNLVVEVLTHRVGDSYDDSEKDDIKDDKDSMVILNESDKPEVISLTSTYRIDESRSIIADDSLISPKDSTDSLSGPSSRCTVSAGLPTAIVYEKDISRLRLLEAKSISAQCSPILPRQKPSSSHSATQTHGKLKSQVSYSDDVYSGVRGESRRRQQERNSEMFLSRQNTSEDSANLTISTFVNEADSIPYGSWAAGSEQRKSKSTSLLVVTDKSNKKAINRLDCNSIVSYQSNPLMRGLISSFNQLTTTTSNYFPVITTTVATLPQSVKQPLSISSDGHVIDDPGAMRAIATSSILPSDTAKLQRMTSTSTGSSAAPIGCCATKSSSKEKDKRFKPGWETGQSGSDDEYRKRKKKYKRYHRCSDPVLVYPSSGGLQHCILSMPPNQPIQFHYNDDFVYDMTLEVETDQNGDLQAIVPSHRSRHRHHRHKKRHRHKKQKILVHDLDTRSVKVIDPDDLSQRARWTIIATAFLLLIMCLMLVGITLRMAPIIDDMGKYSTYNGNIS